MAVAARSGREPFMMGRLLPASALVLALLPQGLPAAEPGAPPNAPADIRVEGDRILVVYDGATLFDGRIGNPGALRAAVPSVATRDGAVDQVLALFARQGEIELTGTVAASVEAFPCESDRAFRALPVVRHSSGLSRSRLNQAVYDRRRDWALSVDDRLHTPVTVTPLSDTPGGRTFTLTARGREIVLRFRPRFYQRHRGLALFEPWTYAVWPRPVVGWCSWFAFFDKVADADVRRTADVVSEVLLPYGYDVLQIDDGYQRGTGLPELWLTPNAKFPEGLEATAAYIRKKGLTPGIWTNATFSQTEYAEQHRDFFVRDASGGVARGNWIDHAVDATAEGALETLVRPIYSGLRSMGWEYFKLDALRHLRYEGYNSYRGHFERKSSTPGEALRRYVAGVREEIGRDRFLLACWGVRPELVGLVDGCRIGTDGFSYAGLAQYNSFNNVVWRNDPDHVELSDSEAWRSTMVTSLTGSLLLLTDKPERYRTAFAEPARRAAPVLSTVPGQLYDVDPSRSSELGRVDAEVSGRDPKPFDAGLTPAVHLYLLEVNRPFESWVVLGRTGGTFGEIGWDDLGLDPKKRYLVFEFWERRFQAPDGGTFAPGDVPAKYHSQAFVIRERQDHPQLVATSRHLTGGGVDLLDVRWKDGVLSGRSAVVGGEPYEIFLTEAAGLRLAHMRCDGAAPLPAVREGGLVHSGCRPGASGEIAWSARFEKSGSRVRRSPAR
jgi:alpha-galactosidase